MSSVFYRIPPIPNRAIVVKTGYLLKSPPYSLLKRENVWRRRFFVLYKLNKQEYQLKYFHSEKEDRAQGEIDLKQVTKMLVCPDGHPQWSWVQKNVNCSPSCVLYINTSAREYFLVGNNSSDVNEWLIALSKPCLAEENLYEVVDPNRETEREWKLRSRSEPPALTVSSVKIMVSLPRPSSEPVDNIYDYPKAYWNKQPEPVYMSMDQVDAGLHTDDRLAWSDPQVFDKLATPTRQRSASFLAPTMEASENSILKHVQRDVVVQQTDLKEHLALLEVDGRLSVLRWTGQPLGLFHEGDQLLALNDLVTCSMADFHAYLSRTLKKLVKLTILRELKGANLRRHSV